MKYVLLVLAVLLFSCSKRNEEVVAEINGHKLYASELSQVTRLLIGGYLLMSS